MALCLYNRENLPANPLVQVTRKDMTEKAVENPLSPKSANQPKCVLVQFSLHAVDGDGNILTLKVATHLNTSCCLIEAGSIIRLGNCNPVYYN